MKAVHAFLAVTMLIAAAAPSPAAEPLAPAKQWVVDFAEQRCTATREYGADGEALLALKPSPDGDIMQLTLAVAGAALSEPRELRGELSIDGQPPIAARALAHRADGLKMRVYRINLTSGEFAPLKRATRLSIDLAPDVELSPTRIPTRLAQGLDVDLALTQMPALTKQIDTCLADLRQHWNIAEPARSKVATSARGDLRSLFDGDDYPGISIQDRDAGSVRAVLLVDEAGKVADCVITQTSRVAALDAQTCAVLQTRAKFEPARGADGEPLRSSVSTPPITWRISG